MKYKWPTGTARKLKGYMSNGQKMLGIQPVDIYFCSFEQMDQEVECRKTQSMLPG